MTLLVIMGYSAVYTITPESFSPDIRNIGVGVPNSASKVACIICPVFTGYMLTQNNGFEISLMVFAGLFGLSGLSALFLKETRVKKSEKNLLLY